MPNGTARPARQLVHSCSAPASFWSKAPLIAGVKRRCHFGRKAVVIVQPSGPDVRDTNIVLHPLERTSVLPCPRDECGPHRVGGDAPGPAGGPSRPTTRRSGRSCPDPYGAACPRCPQRGSSGWWGGTGAFEFGRCRGLDLVHDPHVDLRVHGHGVLVTAFGRVGDVGETLLRTSMHPTLRWAISLHRRPR